MIIYTYIYGKVTNTIKSVDTSVTVVSSFFVCVVRSFKIYSYNFKVYITLLLNIVTLLYARAPELIPLTGSWNH